MVTVPNSGGLVERDLAFDGPIGKILGMPAVPHCGRLTSKTGFRFKDSPGTFSDAEHFRVASGLSAIPVGRKLSGSTAPAYQWLGP